MEGLGQAGLVLVGWAPLLDPYGAPWRHVPSLSRKLPLKDSQARRGSYVVVRQLSAQPARTLATSITKVTRTIKRPLAVFIACRTGWCCSSWVLSWGVYGFVAVAMYWRF
jgi:hypothetical protein